MATEKRLKALSQAGQSFAIWGLALSATISLSHFTPVLRPFLPSEVCKSSPT